MATQIELRPKPRLAMLHGEPGWLRSRIRPVVALASYQKKRNAEYWTESSSAAVFWARAGVGQASSPSSITMVRFMVVLSTRSGSELDSDRHAVRAAQTPLVGPGVVELVIIQVEPALEPGPERQPQLRVLLERVLVAGPQRERVAQRPLGAGAHALGVVAGMERVERQPQPVPLAQPHRVADPDPEQHRQRELPGELLGGQGTVVAGARGVGVVDDPQVAAGVL